MVSANQVRESDARPGRRPRFIEVITAVGAIATPLLVLFLSGMGWIAKEEIQRQNKLEEALRQDRVETYNKILEPFVILLMTDAAWQSDPLNHGRSREEVATRLLLSTDYRHHGFKLSLVGSDSVVRAYGDLMQYTFHLDPSQSGGPEQARALMALLGGLLLEIRRDAGNERTHLDRWNMLEWFVTDARQYRAQGRQ